MLKNSISFIIWENIHLKLHADDLISHLGDFPIEILTFHYPSSEIPKSRRLEIQNSNARITKITVVKPSARRRQI